VREVVRKGACGGECGVLRGIKRLARWDLVMTPDVMSAFYDRVRRRVAEGIKAYRDELRAISHQMAASGGVVSGNHLVKRLEAFKRWMQTVTDECFEEVTRLPGTQSIHREVHEPFLRQQLLEFFILAKPDIFISGVPEAAKNEIEQRTVPIRENFDRDLRDFQVGLWRPRKIEGRTFASPATPVTHNNVTIHNSNVGVVQQAGEGSVLTSTVTFNAQAVQTALDDLMFSLRGSDLSGDVKSAAMIEIETIRPQLMKASPNASIVREGLHSLRNILEGVVAGVLSSKLMALLSAAGMS
jgi:hypothetical protein